MNVYTPLPGTFHQLNTLLLFLPIQVRPTYALSSKYWLKNIFTPQWEKNIKETNNVPQQIHTELNWQNVRGQERLGYQQPLMTSSHTKLPAELRVQKTTVRLQQCAEPKNINPVHLPSIWKQWYDVPLFHVIDHMHTYAN